LLDVFPEHDLFDRIVAKMAPCSTLRRLAKRGCLRSPRRRLSSTRFYSEAFRTWLRDAPSSPHGARMSAQCLRPFGTWDWTGRSSSTRTPA
jgi:hypothetical protein